MWTVIQVRILSYSPYLLESSSSFVLAYLSSFLDRLVHGPLTALLLLELTSSNVPKGRRIVSFSYRAKHPVIVNRPLALKGVWLAGGTRGKVWAANETGVVCMLADVHLQ